MRACRVSQGGASGGLAVSGGEGEGCFSAPRPSPESEGRAGGGPPGAEGGSGVSKRPIEWLRVWREGPFGPSPGGSRQVSRGQFRRGLARPPLSWACGILTARWTSLPRPPLGP